MARWKVERLDAAMKDKKTVDDRMVRDLPGAADGAKWEYKNVVASRTVNLDQYGADGWELVSAVPQPGDQVAYYFKRRK